MQIEVTRPKQLADGARAYKVCVDGKKVATIKSGQSIALDIPDDAQYIQGKVDWCSSPELPISEIKSGKVILANRLSPNPLAITNSAATQASMLYYITFGRKEYLSIESPS